MTVEFKNLIEQTIEEMPYFGEISLPVKLDELKIDHTEDSVKQFLLNDPEINKISNSYNDFSKSLEQTERAMKWLVDNGFAVNRRDIPIENKPNYSLYRQLTDKGRILKDKGTLSAFNDYEEDCRKKEARRITRDENLYWIQFWIAIGAIWASFYYSLDILNHFFGFYCY